MDDSIKMDTQPDDDQNLGQWDEEIKKCVDQGYFSRVLKNLPRPSLDLNEMLPTFAELGKLDIKVEWLVSKLIPSQAITVLHAKGGGYKTYLSLQLGSCVADGRPFAGLATQKIPTYYIDFENSLSILCDRARVLGPSEMKVWHLSNSLPPPRLDTKEDWKLFKGLLPGLLIFDTLRSSQLLDENSSKDMALIMSRLKELREFGHTIILIHHAPRRDEKTYKGSSAISDLCDHCLGLEKVRAVGSEEVIDDDDREDLPFRLGVRGKSRYEPFSIFLHFDPQVGFSAADDPDSQLLSDMRDLLENYCSDSGTYPNQSNFQRNAKADLEISKSQFRRLLRKGMGSFWTENRQKKDNATLYFPVFRGRNNNIDLEGTKDIGFSGYPKGIKENQDNRFSGFPPPLREEKTSQPETNDPLEDQDEGE